MERWCDWSEHEHLGCIRGGYFLTSWAIIFFWRRSSTEIVTTKIIIYVRFHFELSSNAEELGLNFLPQLHQPVGSHGLLVVCSIVEWRSIAFLLCWMSRNTVTSAGLLGTLKPSSFPRSRGTRCHVSSQVPCRLLHALPFTHVISTLYKQLRLLLMSRPIFFVCSLVILRYCINTRISLVSKLRRCVGFAEIIGKNRKSSGCGIGPNY